MSSAELIQDELFIVFGEDYGRHPHALEHLLRPLFPYNHFLWVETIGLRSPKLTIYDLKRILEKLLKWAKRNSPKAEIPSTVEIIRPFMIPYNQFRLVRAFNRFSVKRAVRKALDRQTKAPITITSVPNAADYIGEFNEKLRVYFCVDEFSLWPGLNYNLVKTLEDDLMRKVDLIFATAGELARKKSIQGKETQVLTHGVDFSHFSKVKNRAPEGNIRLCYMGLFDERSDQAMIIEILQSIPDLEFHLVGKVVVDIARLKAHPRVIIHGSCAYSELPEKLEQMDLLILPYIRSVLTDSINPLKLKEYLATGRPVLSTRLPEVVKFNEFVWLGDHAQDFIEHIALWRDGIKKHDAQKTKSYLEANETWHSKSAQVSQWLRSQLGE
jgi:glycosyltransferase involved in cell wall biosynthesis